MSTHPIAARRPLALAALGVAVACVTYACADGAGTTRPSDAPAASRDLPAGVHRQYGAPVKLGDGRARTYVLVD